LIRPILFMNAGICWLSSAVSSPSARVLSIWLNVVVYCDIFCTRLLMEVSLLFKAWYNESRECMDFRALSLNVLGFFFLTGPCAKLLPAENKMSNNKPSAANFDDLRIVNSFLEMGLSIVLLKST